MKVIEVKNVKEISTRLQIVYAGMTVETACELYRKRYTVEPEIIYNYRDMKLVYIEVPNG